LLGLFAKLLPIVCVIAGRHKAGAQMLSDESGSKDRGPLVADL